MHIGSFAHFAENETSRMFETAQAFHPILVCFYITPVLLQGAYTFSQIKIRPL